MFIWLTNPTIGQVLVNLNLVTAVTCVQGRNTVCIYLCTGYERMVANGNENSE